jgi:hypothetical protein
MLTVLKTLDIDDVEEGMFADSIAKQQGKFKIISRGRVTSLAATTHLRNKVILSVVVDMSKQIKPEVVAQQEPEPEKTTVPPEEVSFEAELGVAAKLHIKDKHLQKTMLKSLGKTYLSILPSQKLLLKILCRQSIATLMH